MLVKGDSYVCSRCKKSFSRKWNAERHNERKHDDLSAIRHKKTKLDFQPKLKTKGPHKKKPILSPSFDSALKDIDPGKSPFSHETFGPDIIKIMKIYGQLARPFEELEELMDDYDEKSKNSTLCRIFISCLKSSRPVKSMNETAKMHRAMKFRKKIEKQVAMAYNMSADEAALFLESIIRNSSYSKRNIN